MGIERMDERVINLWEGFPDRGVRERVLSCAGELIDRDFDVEAVPTASEANRSIITRIDRHKTVYYWDAVVLEELGILETLSARGNKLNSVFTARGLNLGRKGRLPEGSVYLTTACAITSDGMLVKLEPEGVPLFMPKGGPELVVAVAGVNNLVDTIADGFRRAKDTCVPLAATRLGMDLPCVVKKECVECATPSPLCVVNTVITRKPEKPEILVVLIGEYLGR
jgi:hypothetical protein